MVSALKVGVPLSGWGGGAGWGVWVGKGGGAHLRIEQSRFEPWPGTLCCAFGQDTFHSSS